MPQRHLITLELRGDRQPLARHLHGLVCRWIEGGWADGRHHSQVKPFTVTPLRALADPDLYALEVTLLDDRLESRLGDSLADGARLTVLGALEGRVLPDETGSLSSVIDSKTWEQLWAASMAVDEVEFHFLTPTVFRSGQDAVPEPTISRIFGHLRARWRHFDPDTEPTISFANCGAVMAKAPAERGTVVSRYRTWPGFLGTARFDLAKCHPSDRKAFDALASLAPFAGVGANTTFGMGVTRRGSVSVGP